MRPFWTFAYLHELKVDLPITTHSNIPSKWELSFFFAYFDLKFSLADNILCEIHTNRIKIDFIVTWDHQNSAHIEFFYQIIKNRHIQNFIEPNSSINLPKNAKKVKLPKSIVNHTNTVQYYENTTVAATTTDLIVTLPGFFSSTLFCSFSSAIVPSKWSEN